MGIGARLRRACPFLKALSPTSLHVVGDDAAGVALGQCRPDDPGWLDLVSRSPAATAFHLPAWSAAVSATYGYPAFILAQRSGDGRVVSGLPVMEVSSPLGRRRLVSLPFTDHCPPLGGDPALFGEAIARWREAHRNVSLEVRAELPTDDARARVVGTRHVLALEPEPSALFHRLDRNQIRRRGRRAREFGIQAAPRPPPPRLPPFLPPSP